MVDDAKYELLKSQFGQFAQSTSHILSDPLRKVISMCKNGDMQADVILKETEDVLKNIKNLRTYSFFCLGDLRLSDVNVKYIFEDIFDILKKQITENQINISLSEMPNIRADSTQILEAFTEIIRNSIKFSPIGSNIRVEFSEDDKYHIFSFIDQGSYISEPYLDKIFYMGVRAENADLVEGSGIGLAMVSLVAYNHGGDVSVQSQESGGNIFKFKINKSL
ncbi:HAMP domain-containing histidine kinase [Rickettsiales bacterium]|nr:HAMP domain-containing histidine kinase [Rickettsiales bacterium]